ncbi:hypothetical protein WR25_02162 [Diploscapter pachys]|uniref:Uncharacterized protein n=1 Tax=Diploscapter pachys TaxID=2018661 RepID=A0A2A2M2A2_9BILA|nr:hypothetical protein WR25_02162 [Diploscapter pachys]
MRNGALSGKRSWRTMRVRRMMSPAAGQAQRIFGLAAHPAGGQLVELRRVERHADAAHVRAGQPGDAQVRLQAFGKTRHRAMRQAAHMRTQRIMA